MGVPRFASHLKKKWPGIAAKRDKEYSPGDKKPRKKFGAVAGGKDDPGQARVPDKIAALYVDMNGIIHPCCHSEDDPRVAAAPRAEKIRRVLAAVDDLVQRTQPEALLYLAMDGVAPRAKMNQQRSRRYMAAVAKHGTVRDGGFAPEPVEKAEALVAAAALATAATKSNTSSSSSPTTGASANEKKDDQKRDDDVVPAGLPSDDKSDLAHALDLGIYAGGSRVDDTPAKKSNSSMGDPFMSMDTPEGVSQHSGREHTSKFDDDDTAIPPLPPAMFPTSPPRPPQQEAKAEGAGAGEEYEVFDENRMGGFDSNCISPGTSFMEAMTAALKEFVSAKLRSGEWSKDLAVIVSGSDEPGEGEHKLIDFMRRFSTSHGWPRGAHVIHGLDADLILLCLSLHISNVFILRDNDRRVIAPVAGATGTTAAEPKATSIVVSSPVDPANPAIAGGDDDDEESDEDSSEDDADGATTIPKPATDITRTPSRSPMAGPILMTPERRAAMNRINLGINGSGGGGDALGADAAGFKQKQQQQRLVLAPLPPPVVSPMLSSSNSNNKNQYGHRAAASPVESKKPQLSSQQEVFDIYLVAEYIVAEISTLAVSVHGASIYDKRIAGNGKHIVDDFVFLCSILGNDFMPRLPSAFAGEAAIDNMMEVYARRVLPLGAFITVPLPVASSSSSSSLSSLVRCPDINLYALLIFMEGYADIEAALFRRFSVAVRYLPDDNRSCGVGAGFQEGLDRVWADKYHASTTCTKENTRAACEKYLEGMRFVFEYYAKTSASCSWRWFYPFHHAPFAHNMVAHLRHVLYGSNHNGDGEARAAPASPPVEKEAPSPFVQLLCILPPTSLCLLPKPLRKIMVRPPPGLQSSFPCEWKVDMTCSEGQEHLSTVMIPFADLEGIAEELKKVLGADSEHGGMTAEQRRRGVNQRELSCIIVHPENKSLYRTPSVAGSLAALDSANNNNNNNKNKNTSNIHAALKIVNVMRLKFEGEVDASSGIIQVPFAMPHEGGGGADASSVNKPASSPAFAGGGRGGKSGSIVGSTSSSAGALRHTANGLLQVPNLPVLPSSWGENGRGKGGKATGSHSFPSSGGTHIGQLALFSAVAVSAVSLLIHITSTNATATTTTTTTSSSSSLEGSSSSGGAGAGVSFMSIATNIVRTLALVLPFFWFVVSVCTPNVSLTMTTHRNQVRETFNDWLCTACGSLTFQSGLLCFRCGAPYDETVCPRVMSGRLPKMPPVLSVEHAPHMVDCILRVDKKFHAMAE